MFVKISLSTIVRLLPTVIFAKNNYRTLIAASTFSHLQLDLLSAQELGGSTFKVKNIFRRVGYIPSLTVGFGGRNTHLIGLFFIGIASTPKKFYLPPFGARFLFGNQLFFRIPFESSEPNKFAMGFLVGLGSNFILKNNLLSLSRTRASHTSIDFQLPLGLSFLFENTFKIYLSLGPYMTVDLATYQGKTYNTFMLIPWGIKLPEIGFMFFYRRNMVKIL